MLAEFEKSQLETRKFLSTDERIKKEDEYLLSIIDELGTKIKREIVLRPEQIACTDKDTYEYRLNEIIEKCKEILTDYFKRGCGYQFDLSYEENMNNFTTVVFAQIKNALNTCSRYTTSRSEVDDLGIKNDILNAAKQWFLTPEDCSMLKEAGYWNMRE